MSHGRYFCLQSRCNEEHLQLLNILLCLVGFSWLCQDKQPGERMVQRGPLVCIPAPREEGKVPGPVFTDLDLHGPAQIPKLRSFPSRNFFFTRSWLVSAWIAPLLDSISFCTSCIPQAIHWALRRPLQLSLHLCIRHVLSEEFVSVEDTLTGARRVEKGPCIWFPGPYEEWEFLDQSTPKWSHWQHSDNTFIVLDEHLGRFVHVILCCEARQWGLAEQHGVCHCSEHLLWRKTRGQGNPVNTLSRTSNIDIAFKAFDLWNKAISIKC